MKPEKPRRAPGEGSVYPRERDGKKYFVGMISITDALGNRKRRETWAASEPAARAKLAQLKAKAITGSLPSTARITLAEYLAHWIANDAPAKVQPSTLLRYDSLVRKWIVPATAAFRLAALEDRDAAKIFKKLRSAGASDSTVSKCYTVIRSALSDAERAKLIVADPFRLVPEPDYEAEEIEPYSIDEIRKFLAAARGTRFQHLFTTALFTQIREGELLALRRAQVNIDEGFVIVTRGIQDQGTGERTTAGTMRVKRAAAKPKTRAGRRRVDLPAIVVNALRAQLIATSGPLVFPSQAGTSLTRQNLLRRHLYPIMAKAELRQITFHALRHSGNTLLAERVPLMVLSQRLGHASTKTTGDVYGHLSPTMQREAVAFIDELFPAESA